MERTEGMGPRPREEVEERETAAEQVDLGNQEDEGEDDGREIGACLEELYELLVERTSRVYEYDQV